MEEFWLVGQGAPNAPTVSMTCRILLTQGQRRMDGRLFHLGGLTLIYGVRCDPGSSQLRTSTRFRTSFYSCQFDMQYSAPEKITSQRSRCQKTSSVFIPPHLLAIIPFGVV